MTISEIKEALDLCLTISVQSMAQVNLIQEFLPGYHLDVVDVSTVSMEGYEIHLLEVLSDDTDYEDDDFDIDAVIVDDFYN